MPKLILVTLFLFSLQGFFVAQPDIEYFKTPKSWHSFVRFYIAKSGNRVVLINSNCSGIDLSEGEIKDDRIEFIQAVDYNARVEYRSPKNDTTISVFFTLNLNDFNYDDSFDYCNVFVDYPTKGAALNNKGKSAFQFPADQDSIHLTIDVLGFDRISLSIPTEHKDVYVSYDYNSLGYYKETYLDIFLDKNNFYFESRGKRIKFRRSDRDEISALSKRLEGVPEDLAVIVERLLGQ